jgi:hypothetical protein
MPHPSNTTFTKYELTAEELTQAHLLTPLHKARYQSLRAEAAEEKLNLEFDPQNPYEFAKRRDILTGMMIVYDYLLEAAQTAEREVRETLNPQRN